MKGNKIFSFELFSEAFRQTKKAGLTSLIIFLLEAIIIPLGAVVNYYGEKRMNGVELQAEKVGIFNTHFIIVLLPVVVAPLLVLVAYRFLNKRNSSDFMHSIPFSRECIFISYFAAVCAWLGLIGIGSTAVSLLVTAVFKDVFQVLILDFLLPICTVVITSVFVSAAVALAMSITGTLLNNFVVSGIIIFVPRFFLTVIYSLISQVRFVSSMSFFGNVLSKNYNLIWSPIYKIFGEIIDNAYPVTQLVKSWECMLYMFVIAAICFAAGLICFKYRRSEAAGAPSLNKYVQAACRIIVCMIICTIPCRIIAGYIISEHTADGPEAFIIAVLYIIALVAYFIYELITTRKAKDLLHAAKGLIIVAVLNALLIAAMIGIYHAEVNTVLVPDSVSYIKFDQSGGSSYVNGNESNYMYRKWTDVKIKDKAVIKELCERLSETVKEFDINDQFAENDDTVYTNSVSICFHTWFKDVKRRLTVTETTYNRLFEALSEEPEYKEMTEAFYREMADNAEKYIDHAIIAGDAASAASSAELLRVRSEEMLELGFKDRFVVMKGEKSIGEIVVSVDGGYITMNITHELPRTVKKYGEISAQRIAERAKENEKFVKSVLEDPDEKGFYMGAHAWFKDKDGEAVDYLYVFDITDGAYSLDAFKVFAERCLIGAEQADESERHAEVLIELEIYDKDGYNYKKDGYQHCTIRSFLPEKYYTDIYDFFKAYSYDGEEIREK